MAMQPRYSAFPSASNQLHDGKVRNFAEGMVLVMRMCEQESYPDAREYPLAEGGRVEIEINESLKRLAQIAQRCLRDFRLWKGTPAGLAERWLAEGGEEREAIASALLTGNYADLAI